MNFEEEKMVFSVFDFWSERFVEPECQPVMWCKQVLSNIKAQRHHEGQKCFVLTVNMLCLWYIVHYMQHDISSIRWEEKEEILTLGCWIVTRCNWQQVTVCSVLFIYESLAGSLAGLTLVGMELLSPASVCAVLMLTCGAASSSMIISAAICLLCVWIFFL